MRKVTSAGPVSTGGVGVAVGMGICVEFWAMAETGKIALPPAKALASKNFRRVNWLASRSFIVGKQCDNGVGQQRESSPVGMSPLIRDSLFHDVRGSMPR